MTNKLVVIRNSLKVPKIKKILLYEIKFLVPNYTCLRNPWLGGYAPRSPFPLPSVLKWICWTPAYEQNSWVRHCTLVHSSINSVVLRQVHSLAKSEFSTGWIFMKFDIWVFFENLSQKKFKFLQNLTRKKGHFTWKGAYVYDQISLNSYRNEKCFRQKLQRKSKHTFRAQKHFPKIVPLPR